MSTVAENGPAVNHDRPPAAPRWKDVEVWLIVDEDGDYIVDTSAEGVAQSYAMTYGSNCLTGTNRVKVTVRVPVPAVLQLTADAVEEA